MEAVTVQIIQSFLQRLGERVTSPVRFYLLGGSALCLLGNERETRDLDYAVDMQEMEEDFQTVLKELSAEFNLDLEAVPLQEFIPLPPGAAQRKRWVGKYGQMEVYIYDLYSIALSKIARGFESDLEDVIFMLKRNFITLPELERLFQAILPKAVQADIDPKEFRAYFSQLKQRLEQV